MRILGLDEAGRGCVIGPLVVGAFGFEGDQAELRAAGADDSKALSPAKRAAVYVRLATMGRARVIEVPPSRIDEGNVNELEIEAFLQHVSEFRPDRVYLDAPVHPRGIKALTQRLVRASGVADWVVEPKADSTYPVVGAASIAAKLCRDSRIEALDGVGSGYPSDPVTRAHLLGFIQRGEAFPPYVRTRWATLDNLRQGQLFG
ncbi:MAG: ribonuclease HII [Deltaproteobacteria bacterium]|nr:ribonuclease HII [Deltaproteobacteria bacterium]